MRIPGFGRPERRVIVDPATGREFVEREPGVVVTDARGATVPPVHEPGATGRDERRAYEAGRVDAQRSRRRGPGLLGLIVGILAIIGLVWLFLAWREGSFSGGAAVVDRQLNAVSDQTRSAADKARSDAGQAVENAGQAIKNQGEKLKP